jgi:hypothetical protein
VLGRDAPPQARADTASAIRSAPGDSSIGCEELMATQRQIGSKHPSRDADSIGLIRAVDPVANGQRLMKSIDP